MIQPGPVIAIRRLYYSVSTETARRPFSIVIRGPVRVRQGDVNFDVGPGLSSCLVEFEGVSQPAHIVYGVDEVQALQFATDVDPFLRRLTKRGYDLYFEDGEPYFADE